MVKTKLYRQNHTQKHTHTHSQKRKSEKYVYIVAPKVHLLNWGWFIFYSGIPQMQGTSSWLWRFNSLLLRLLREIALSCLCSHSSRGSALDLDPPLHVGCLRASVLRSDKDGFKGAADSGVLPHSGLGEGGLWSAGRDCSTRGHHDIAPAWDALCVLPGKLSLDYGSLAVVGCTGSWEGRCG